MGMKARVKAVAIRVLTHSDKDTDLMHRTMHAELGDEYTQTDRELLEDAVNRSHEALRRELDAL